MVYNLVTCWKHGARLKFGGLFIAIPQEDAKKAYLPPARKKQMRSKLTNLLMSATLLSVCGLAYGQAEVWACQSIKEAGLKWENSQWVTTAFLSQNYLITIDGDNSTYSINGRSVSTACHAEWFGVRCNNDSGGTILLNTNTGLGGISVLLGGLVTPTSTDNLSVAAIQCTKF